MINCTILNFVVFRIVQILELAPRFRDTKLQVGNWNFSDNPKNKYLQIIVENIVCVKETLIALHNFVSVDNFIRVLEMCTSVDGVEVKHYDLI